MAQGWYITTASGGSIVFYEPPAAGQAIQVTQNPIGGTGGSDVWAIGAWSGHYGFPSEVEFFGDRLWFASTITDPQTIWASCIGDYTNFGRSSPIIDSDAVSFTNNARQVNVITDLVPLDSLLVMTTGGEFKVTGGADEVVTPASVGLKNQGNYGSGQIPAVVIGESAIFMQQQGPKLRDLGYQFEKDGFRGTEISIWAEHLFTGYVFTQIDFWKAPYSVLWLVREDGIRVGCTYLPEQEINGFHWHDTDGEWIDACTLPGDIESQCYYIGRRVIDGEPVQYIELQAPTRFEDESDLFYVDAGSTYDGRNRTGTTLRITGITYAEGEELTIIASTPIFTGGTGDLGDALVLRRTVIEPNEDGDMVEVLKTVRVIITATDTTTSVRAESVGDVPAALQNVAVTDWDFRRDTIGDLWHLEGRSVRVLQDAAVTGPYMVENGAVVLQEPGGVVQVGLNYSAEIVTLELNNPGGESIRDMNKLTYKASILVLGTRGVLCGPVGGPMDPIKDRSTEPFGQPPYLKTGIREINISAGWGEDAGQVRFLSEDPLPMEILSITVKAAVGG